MSDATDLATVAADAADGKGGTDIVILDVASVLGICDLFVLVTAGNDRQVKAIVDATEAAVAERLERRPIAIEGADARRWVLVDYGDVVIHVFQSEERAMYRLERLYGDAPRVPWTPPVPEPR